jgi:hypothetical protein
MEQMIVSEQSTRFEKLASNNSATGYGLNVSLVYEDAETQTWARDAFQRAASVAGPETVRSTWWKLDDLSAPGVLAGAISTAMRADVIVIATRAKEGLSMPFYLWAETWAAHRGSVRGALVAILGASPWPTKEQARLREYLRKAAEQSRMDFVLEERQTVEVVRATNNDSPAPRESSESAHNTEFAAIGFAS